MSPTGRRSQVEPENYGRLSETVQENSKNRHKPRGQRDAQTARLRRRLYPQKYKYCPPNANPPPASKLNMPLPQAPNIDHVDVSQSEKGQCFPACYTFSMNSPKHLSKCRERRSFATWTEGVFPRFQEGVPGEQASRLHLSREGSSPGLLEGLLGCLVATLPLETGR